MTTQPLAVSRPLHTGDGLSHVVAGWTLDQAVRRLQQAAELEPHETAKARPKFVDTAGSPPPQPSAMVLAQAFARLGTPVWLVPACPDPRLCGEGLQAVVAVAEPGPGTREGKSR